MSRIELLLILLLCLCLRVSSKGLPEEYGEDSYSDEDLCIDNNINPDNLNDTGSSGTDAVDMNQTIQALKDLQDEIATKSSINECPGSDSPRWDDFTNDNLWVADSSMMHSGTKHDFMIKRDVPEGKWCSSKKFKSIYVKVNATINSTQDTDPAEKVQLYENGTMLITSTGYQQVVSHLEYCIVIKSNEEIHFQICQNYIQKCCPKDKVLDGSNPQSCVEITEGTRWVPTYYRDNHKIHTDTDSKVALNMSITHNNILIGQPTCPSTYLISSHLDQKFPNLYENGTLVIVDAKTNKRTVLQPGQFCIDGIYVTTTGEGEEGIGSKVKNSSVPSYSGSEYHQGMVACTPDSDEIPIPAWIPPLYATVNHTAALFLLLTSVVYLLLWSHQNIHGWLQFSYALSLFFAFSFLAIVQVWSKQIFDYSNDLCAKLGWLIHLTFLSAFFWLTSMNFDLWWRFGRRSLRQIRSKPCRENIKLFLFFALFSLGIPLIICGIAVAFDCYYKDHMPEDLFIQLPKFGREKCYFHDKKSQFPFLYGPVGILLAINLLFFTSTVVQLRRIHSNTEFARSNSTLEDKKGVRLIAKLFIVMGVLWIFEFISWAANMIFPESEYLLIWLFLPTDILNSLQGIAIFVIFICKPNVLSQLSAKFRSIQCK